MENRITAYNLSPKVIHEGVIRSNILQRLQFFPALDIKNEHFSCCAELALALLVCRCLHFASAVSIFVRSELYV